MIGNIGGIDGRQLLADCGQADRFLDCPLEIRMAGWILCIGRGWQFTPEKAFQGLFNFQTGHGADDHELIEQDGVDVKVSRRQIRRNKIAFSPIDHGPVVNGIDGRRSPVADIPADPAQNADVASRKHPPV